MPSKPVMDTSSGTRTPCFSSEAIRSYAWWSAAQTPGGDAILDALAHIRFALFLRHEIAGVDVDDVFLGDWQPQPDHLFDKRAEATQGPLGLDPRRSG